jgi:hypothetical protein
MRPGLGGVEFFGVKKVKKQPLLGTTGDRNSNLYCKALDRTAPEATTNQRRGHQTKTKK